MNNKQRFGYMILGAIIMLVGVGVGIIVSPPLIAQNNGVFDKVICKEFTVVDKTGNPRILIDVNERATIGILNKTGDLAAYLVSSEHGSMLNLNFLSGEQAVVLSAFDRVGADIRIFNKAGNVIWQSPIE